MYLLSHVSEITYIDTRPFYREHASLLFVSFFFVSVFWVHPRALHLTCALSHPIKLLCNWTRLLKTCLGFFKLYRRALSALTFPNSINLSVAFSNSPWHQSCSSLIYLTFCNLHQYCGSCLLVYGWPLKQSLREPSEVCLTLALLWFCFQPAERYEVLQVPRARALLLATLQKQVPRQPLKEWAWKQNQAQGHLWCRNPRAPIAVCTSLRGWILHCREFGLKFLFIISAQIDIIFPLITNPFT